MGIVAYYVGQYIDGKNACLIALEYCKVSGDPRINTELDNKNLQFYLEKEREIGERNPTNLDEQIRQRQQQRQQEQHDTTTTKIITRKQFVDEKMIEIQKEHPNLTPKQIHTRANMLWKNKQQK